MNKLQSIFWMISFGSILAGLEPFEIPFWRMASSHAPSLALTEWWGRDRLTGWSQTAPLREASMVLRKMTKFHGLLS